MRKHVLIPRLLIALIAGLIFIQSCNNQPTTGNIPIENRNTPLRDFRHALAKLNIKDQKKIFNGLSPNLRSAIWNDRIEEAMDSSLTKEQKDVLEQISGHLTPSVYNSDSVNSRKEFEVFFDEWVPNAASAFKSDTAKFLFITKSLGEENNTEVITKGPIPDCDCNIGRSQSKYNDCSKSTSCTKMSCIYNQYGCGFWWMESCDGVCK